MSKHCVSIYVSIFDKMVVQLTRTQRRRLTTTLKEVLTAPTQQQEIDPDSLLKTFSYEWCSYVVEQEGYYSVTWRFVEEHLDALDSCFTEFFLSDPGWLRREYGPSECAIDFITSIVRGGQLYEKFREEIGVFFRQRCDLSKKIFEDLADDILGGSEVKNRKYFRKLERALLEETHTDVGAVFRIVGEIVDNMRASASLEYWEKCRHRYYTQRVDVYMKKYHKLLKKETDKYNKVKNDNDTAVGDAHESEKRKIWKQGVRKWQEWKENEGRDSVQGEMSKAKEELYCWMRAQGEKDERIGALFEEDSGEATEFYYRQQRVGIKRESRIVADLVRAAAAFRDRHSSALREGTGLCKFTEEELEKAIEVYDRKGCHDIVSNATWEILGDKRHILTRVIESHRPGSSTNYEEPDEGQSREELFLIDLICRLEASRGTTLSLSEFQRIESVIIPMLDFLDEKLVWLYGEKTFADYTRMQAKPVEIPEGGRADCTVEELKQFEKLIAEYARTIDEETHEKVMSYLERVVLSVTPPLETRGSVFDGPVTAMTFGVDPYRQKMTNAVEQRSNLVKCLNLYVKAKAPSWFCWNGVSVNISCSTKLHVDGMNEGKSFHITLGNYTGGELYNFDREKTMQYADHYDGKKLSVEALDAGLTTRHYVANPLWPNPQESPEDREKRLKKVGLLRHYMI